MSSLEIFGWGLAGAFVSYVAVFVLPELRRLLDKEADFDKRRLVIFGIILLFFVGVGGLLTLAIGDASVPKHAFFYGAGWEGIVLKGGGEGVSLATKILDPSDP